MKNLTVSSWLESCWEAVMLIVYQHLSHVELVVIHGSFVRQVAGQSRNIHTLCFCLKIWVVIVTGRKQTTVFIFGALVYSKWMNKNPIKFWWMETPPLRSWSLKTAQMLPLVEGLKLLNKNSRFYWEPFDCTVQFGQCCQSFRYHLTSHTGPLSWTSPWTVSPWWPKRC